MDRRLPLARCIASGLAVAVAGGVVAVTPLVARADTVRPTPAISTDPTFSTVTIRLSGLANAHDELFHASWDPGLSGEVSFETPVGRGFFELAAQPFASDALVASAPRIRTLVTSLGGGAVVPLRGGVAARASGRVAVAWMLYDAVEDRAAQDENELAFGARVDLERPFAGAWNAHVGVRAFRVMTRERIDFVFVGAGIARTWGMPTWLREALE